MNSLSDIQQQQLDSAVHQYLVDNKHIDIAKKYFDASKLKDVANPPTTDYLVKRWILMDRLQAKVTTLEQQLEDTKTELNSVGFVVSHMHKTSPDSLPVAPCVCVLGGHRKPITAVSFHPSFSFLATAGEDCAVKIWDYQAPASTEENSPLGRLERSFVIHTDTVNDVTFDDSGAWLATCSSDATIKLLEVGSFEVRSTLAGHDQAVSCVRFLKCLRQLLSCCRGGTIRLWDMQSSYCVRTFIGQSEWIRCVAVVDGEFGYFASCSNNRSILLWKYDKSSVEGEFIGHNHVVEYIAFAPNSLTNRVNKGITTMGQKLWEEHGGASSGKGACQLLLSASRDKTIKAWEIFTRQCVFTLVGHDNWVRGVAVHPSGRYVISCSDDKSMRVWDAESGQEVSKLADAHKGFLTCVAICNSNLIVATGGLDSKVRLWESKAPQETETVQEETETQ
eukprot:GHVR01120077.1.p1 GENE.GHVR01120077.1~~GHVR01120077.1.p1  ORF type:complete len:449 (+),score=86.22 GHVR01120077.1:39-1385(+)